MRLLLTILIIAFLRLSAGSQTFEWVLGVEIDYEMNPGMVSYAVATAPDGTLWFGGMKELVQFYHEAMGNLFLKHIDASGNELDDYLITGSGVIFDIETDGAGYVYLIGQYIGDLIFWDGYVLEFTGPNINSFITRITPNGAVDWAINLEVLYPNSVAEDILVHGNQLFLAHSEWSESNITEFDNDGNVIRSVNQAQVGIISSLAIDEAGNIYATGSCPGNGSMFGGISYPAPFSYSMYLVKYNPEGMPEWVQFVEDITCVKPQVRIDHNGDIIWAGGLNIEAEFDTLTLLGPAWVYDLFVTKFNPEGQILWGAEVPQVLTGDASVAKLETFSVMPDNSIALGGFTRGIVDWGNGVISNATGMNQDIMVLDIRPDGVPEWVKTGGGTGSEIAVAVDADDNGNFYMAGIGHGTVSFDTNTFTGDSFYFPFLVKLNTGITTDLPESSGYVELGIYPNPSNGMVHIPMDPARISEIRLYDLVGVLVLEEKGSASVDLSKLPPGTYFMKMISREGENYSGKVIKTEYR